MNYITKNKESFHSLLTTFIEEEIRRIAIEMQVLYITPPHNCSFVAFFI